MTKVFESINLDIQEVADFIEANGLSFICNNKMQVEASEEDFNKLIAQFPELDYVEAEPETRKPEGHRQGTMRAYNYLDLDENNTTLVIEKDGYSYEYFEPNEDVLRSCEDWTEMDIHNYMRNNEPVGDPEPIESDEDKD